ncbi:hypothetical protein Tco_0514909 [Tanacetum coccineum]
MKLHSFLAVGSNLIEIIAHAPPLGCYLPVVEPNVKLLCQVLQMAWEGLIGGFELEETGKGIWEGWVKRIENEAKTVRGTVAVRGGRHVSTRYCSSPRCQYTSVRAVSTSVGVCNLPSEGLAGVQNDENTPRSSNILDGWLG